MIQETEIDEFNVVKQQLESYLPHLNKQEGAFSFYELCGFLLVVCSAPEMIPPRDWLPIVLGEDLDIPEELGEPNVVLEALMGLYNWINFRVINGEDPTPKAMEIHEEVFANFGEHTALGQWSKGFYEGHDWLSEVWEEFLNEELEDELSSYLLPLSLFLDENCARALYEDFARQDKSFHEVAEFMLQIFNAAATDYSQLGRSIAELVEEYGEEAPAPQDKLTTFEQEEPKVGRNDPCPCGSGKKYKKCCLH